MQEANYTPEFYGQAVPRSSQSRNQESKLKGLAKSYLTGGIGSAAGGGFTGGPGGLGGPQGVAAGQQALTPDFASGAGQAVQPQMPGLLGQQGAGTMTPDFQSMNMQPPPQPPPGMGGAQMPPMPPGMGGGQPPGMPPFQPPQQQTPQQPPSYQGLQGLLGGQEEGPGFVQGLINDGRAMGRSMFSGY